MGSPTEKWTQDLRALVATSEELLKETAGQTGERIADSRRQLEESVRRARAHLRDAGAAVQDRLRNAAREMNELVLDQPWTAVTAAAVVGFVAGLLLGRR